MLPHLASPAMQQAADDVLAQISDPSGAVALADLLFSSTTRSASVRC